MILNKIFIIISYYFVRLFISIFHQNWIVGWGLDTEIRTKGQIVGKHMYERLHLSDVKLQSLPKLLLNSWSPLATSQQQVQYKMPHFTCCHNDCLWYSSSELLHLFKSLLSFSSPCLRHWDLLCSKRNQSKINPFLIFKNLVCDADCPSRAQATVHFCM